MADEIYITQRQGNGPRVNRKIVPTANQLLGFDDDKKLSGTLTPELTSIGDTSGVNRLVLNPTAKTIVDGSATSLFEVAVAAGASVGGLVHYHVFASDGTDHQAMSGIVSYAAVNKAGTTTKTVTNATANDAKAVSSGTLTLAWTVTDDTNKITVKLQPTGSLTETTYKVTYTVYPIKGTVTIL